MRARAMQWRGYGLAGVAAVIIPLLGPACVEPRPVGVELRSYLRAAGTLVSSDTAPAIPRGRYAKHAVTLRSSTGLVARGWLFRPGGESGCFPAVLLQDGREENSGVIERLPAEFGDVVVLSLDYPDEIPYTIELRDVVRHGERLDRAARRIPALFLLGASYLASRRDVDSTRMAIAATSFAVPFATIAAAADTRFANVALIYGAGDLPTVLAANLRVGPRELRRPLASLAMQRFADLAPERFVRRISPRPLVMVNGIDDPQMPREAVERLYDAARPPKELVWMRTGHLLPTDSALIRTLVDTAMARLPVLQAPVATGSCAR